jgi:hypothetical protein
VAQAVVVELMQLQLQPEELELQTKVLLVVVMEAL